MPVTLAMFFGLGFLIFWWHLCPWLFRAGVAWLLKLGYESYAKEAKK